MSRKHFEIPELETLFESIKDQTNSRVLCSLYKTSYPRFRATFEKFITQSAIISNRNLFALCFQCFSIFMKPGVMLPMSSLILNPMIRVESILRMEEAREHPEEARVSSITISLFQILCFSMYHHKYFRNITLPHISPLLSEIFCLGLFTQLEDSFVESILETCRSIAFATNELSKDSLLSILLPHILPWMKKYPDKKFFLYWTNILKNITTGDDNTTPHEARSSQLWFVFHPVLDVIKDTDSKGITFDDEAVIRCFRFFGNLSCIPSQAIEIHECIKGDLLDSWFEMVMEREENGERRWEIVYWSKLISMLSTVPSIVPHISPKYDDAMEWCKDNGRNCHFNFSSYFGNCYPSSLKKWSDLIGSIKECSQLSTSQFYFGNCYPSSLKKWSDLIGSIKECSQLSTSQLYLNNRASILSVFLAYQSRSEIEEHKREIVLCLFCLKLFVQHKVNQFLHPPVFLPAPDLTDLIDTFIDHLSRVEDVLEGAVHNEYFSICADYTSQVREEHTSFLLRICPAFKHILERGISGKKIRNCYAKTFIEILKNVSLPRSSSSNRSCVFSLIKPYIRDWFHIYKDSKCYGEWMHILQHVTLESDNQTPARSICSEAWSLFHPVLDVVKREFVGDKIIQDNHEYVMGFFSNLCFDISHALEVYENVKDLLDGWFEAVHKKSRGSEGVKCWFRLISMLSIVPSLVSPKYDDSMSWCMESRRCIPHDYACYISNISTSLSTSYLSILLHSVPAITLIPSIETSLYPEKDGYHCASTLLFGMEFEISIPIKNDNILYHNAITGKKMNFQRILEHGDLCCCGLRKDEDKDDSSISSHYLGNNSRILYSPFIQYTPPQHLLVKMSFDDERALRQSVYDFVERTSGGIETIILSVTSAIMHQERDIRPFSRTVSSDLSADGLAMKKGLLPDITMCPIFENLRESPQGGVEIADCFAKVFVGLTKLDPKRRMSVQEARETVQKIKHFLPHFGLGVKCPSIDVIVRRQLKQYGYDKGDICDVDLSVPILGGWDSKVGRGRGRK
ncbi:hypothetical protein ADUPG1_013155 [Aduncisulcus paluster]|uniref:Uncharacterized protein n=1 Tax=Aduncisulcus paluster TaxID=2918883 RepID=A0ABQ5K568_9EUKA|nr:hypothetical protein ADUPG1_013155 [Aduncisulcus paluster]